MGRQSRAVALLLMIVVGLPVLTVACGGGKAVSTTMDDATITARVKTALLNDPQISATRINVETSGGVVTISGAVKSQGEADRAIAIARQVTGVKDVRSSLQPGG